MFRKSRCGQRDILGHWLWALPVLLTVAAIALRQIDLYPSTQDEFHSMFMSGWLLDGPYSPFELMQSDQWRETEQAPLYFILLNLWGNLLTATDLALARVFSIFIGLLSLGMAYRLGRDLLAPAAGLLMLIIMSSNTVYNYYIPFVRPYPLIVLLAGAVLWLYGRIIFRAKFPKTRDYFALFAAVFALLNTHVISATFLASLGIWHLLFAAKNRRWLRTAAMGVIAIVLSLPFLMNMASRITSSIQGVSSSFDVIDGMTALVTWINFMLNSQPGLLIIIAVGLLLKLWHSKTILRPPPPRTDVLFFIECDFHAYPDTHR